MTDEQVLEFIEAKLPALAVKMGQKHCIIIVCDDPPKTGEKPESELVFAMTDDTTIPFAKRMMLHAVENLWRLAE